MKRYACLDIGLKRIGIAICLDETIVLPQDAIIRRNRKQASKDTRDFLIEWEIDSLIVGIPKDGSSSDEMQRRIEHFVSLIDLNDIEIIYQDEQGSSYEAKELTMGQFKHKKDGKIDSIAAKIILERYLNII